MGRSFDRDEWVEAARHRRRLTDGSPMEIVNRFLEDVKFVSMIETLVEWCTRRGLEVTFTAPSGGCYDHDERLIVCSYRSYPEQQLYTLLHEAGHHLVHSSSPTLYRERYEHGYARVTATEKSPDHKVDAIGEEFEAWYRGWRLARRLKLKLKKERFLRVRNKNLRSYFKWGLDIPEYDGP